MTTAKNQTKRMFFQGFILHLHPNKVSTETLRYSLSFGLGGISATLLFLLFVSGILQLLSYTPDITYAYTTVSKMYGNQSLTGLVRNTHYWSGNLLVIIALLHCCRVFFTGALDSSRLKNWYIGLLIFVLVLFANFSGYLLPWDQRAYWAVTIFTSMLGYFPSLGDTIVQLLRGGGEVSQTTLSIFYGIHTGIMPFFLAVLLIYHFWLVRKAGGLVRRAPETKSASGFVDVIPNLVVREAAVGFSTICAILLFSAMVDAPLADMANPSMSPNPAKAAWYFLGFQELLMHLHPSYVTFVLPLLLLAALVLVPLWNGTVTAPGCWFDGEGGGKTVFFSCLAGFFATFGFVLVDEMVRNSNETAANWLSRGLLPVLIFSAAIVFSYFLLKHRFKISRARTVMILFAFNLTALLSLTFIGIWLRGPGMKLGLFF